MDKLIFCKSIIAYCNIHDVHPVPYFSAGACSSNPLFLLKLLLQVSLIQYRSCIWSIL